MFLLKYFLKIWNSWAKFSFGKRKPKFYIKPEHQTELAFECAGVKYYRFISELNIPSERAFKALDVYAELDMGIDKDTLKGYCQNFITQANKGNLVEVAKLASLLEHQLQHITNIALIYKLASVLYFDENENPYEYDEGYCQNKIRFWQENKDLESFFLRLPIANLIPFGNTSKENLQNYIKIQSKEAIGILGYLLNNLDNSDKNKELKERLTSQMALLESMKF